MRSFAQNEDVTRMFKEAALSKSFVAAGKVSYYITNQHFITNSLMWPLFCTFPATSKPVKESKTPDQVLLTNPIQLTSRDPNDYRNDVLAKIIPRILNPLGNMIITVTILWYLPLNGSFYLAGKRMYYDDQSNCPTWFPKSNVTFRRPNHPKREINSSIDLVTCSYVAYLFIAGDKRMQAEEMRLILQSFLDNCCGCYVM